MVTDPRDFGVTNPARSRHGKHERVAAPDGWLEDGNVKPQSKFGEQQRARGVSFVQSAHLRQGRR